MCHTNSVCNGLDSHAGHDICLVSSHGTEEAYRVTQEEEEARTQVLGNYADVM